MTIDNRVVHLGFENEQFERGVITSTRSLDNLKKNLNFDSSTRGLQNLAEAGRNFSLSNIATSVESVSSKFSAFGVVAFTVLQNITNAAINTGKKIVDALALDPLKKGFQEYETQMNAVQTIMANTSSKGTTLAQVNAALDQLNDYSDKTIYNFTEMAKNIGTFTAAGVDLDTSVSAIKGIANLAAVSGSSSQQAAMGMYQLSQALASGTVRLMDWNSVNAAGMGGEVFKNALMDTARVHGVAIDQIIKDEGSFRASLDKGWLTSEVLTETLAKFTGDLNEDQLRTIGYTEEQIVAIMKMAETANDAATKVKTFSQLISTFGEVMQSGWAQTWRIIIGDFMEAREFLTSLSNMINGVVQETGDARNALLQTWNDLGGRTLMIESIKTTLTGLIKILKAISEAFSEIFPPIAAKDLMNLTHLIHGLSLNFKMADGTIQKIKTTFKGLAALLDIGRMALAAVVTEVFKLIKNIPISGKSILDFTSNIGDYIIKLRDSIKVNNTFGKAIEKFKGVITNIGSYINTFVANILKIKDAFVDSFKAYSNIDTSGFKKFISNFKSQFSPLTTIAEFVGKLISGIFNGLKTLTPFFFNFASLVGKIFGKLSEAIYNGFSNFDFDRFFDFINTGLLTTLVLAIKNFLTKGGKVFDGVGDLLKGVTDILDGVRGSLEAWQMNLKAGALLQIAIALGILTASISVLSNIDPEKLTKSLIAMGAMFTQLLGAVAIFEKLPSNGKMEGLVISLIGLSLSILILSNAVKKLGDMDTKTLLKGTLAIQALMISLSVFASSMSSNTANMIKLGAGFILLGLSINILSKAIEKLGSMDIEVIKQGLGGLGIVLLELIAFVKLANNGSNIISTSISIGILSLSMLVLSKAIEQLGSLDIDVIGKGLLTMAASLAIISIAMKMMPANMLLTGVALLGVAIALVILGKALENMGNMSWEVIGRGLAVLAGSLILLAVGLTFMSSSIAGAAALLIAAAALAVLAPVLKTLGNMSLKEIGIALGTLAVFMALLGVAAMALTPVIPTLLALSGAMLLFGLATLAVGTGVLLLSMGLSALAVSGAAAAVAIVTIMTSIIGLLPMIATKVGEMIIAFVEVLKTGLPLILQAFTLILLGLIQAIATVTPPLIAAITVLIVSLLGAIAILAPKFVETAVILLTALLQGLVSFIPTLVQAGFDLLISLLSGIRDNIEEVVTVAIDIVIKFIDGIASKIPDVIETAFNLLLSFINGLSDAIDEYMPKINAAVGKLVKAIIDGLVDGITGGAKSVGNAIANLGLAALAALKKVLGIESPSKETAAVGKFMGQGLVNGINGMITSAKRSAAGLGKETIDSLSEVISTISDIIATDLNLAPTIRPVVDLTDVKMGGEKIGSMLGFSNIRLAGSINKVSDISSNLGGVYNDKNGIVNPANKEVLISFTQNNYSPESLSNAEIYRQTRNQLSRMKGILGVV